MVTLDRPIVKLPGTTVLRWEDETFGSISIGRKGKNRSPILEGEVVLLYDDQRKRALVELDFGIIGPDVEELYNALIPIPVTVDSGLIKAELSKLLLSRGYNLDKLRGYARLIYYNAFSAGEENARRAMRKAIGIHQ